MSGAAARQSASEIVAAPHKAELRALTGIRGLAAWFVVLYHARLLLTDMMPEWCIAVFAKGYLAVDFFFMLSGFVIAYNYNGKFLRQGPAITGAFLWRRLARIWPLHAAILAAMVVFVALLAATGRDYSGYPLAELPLHILLMQNWGFTHDLTWNHPAWSISTELGAYLMFPLLALVVRWERFGNPALFLAMTALLATLYLCFRFTGGDVLGADIARLGLVRCLIEFAVGTVLCVLWQRWRGRPGAALAAGVLALAILVGGFLTGLPETGFVPAGMAVALLALALDRGGISRFLASRVPHWLGEISYSTYLAHFFLLILFKIAFVDASLQMGAAQLAAYLLLVLIASAVLYHGVELPAQRWLNDRMPARLRARVAVTE
ncbi:putative acyltransferase [Caenibius tardaugens NBRC 16725]|uniref:Putative acyltransferase n=1 Tax=Caenibius tardaugens NBRC 16725 TaxID=1219035 RepID=U2ZTL9_9SPHN|nr:acyltransferase [Caenibius tardaugens]GAD48729.1 putative acyltransferase [Caenibius tardaugens NBRC 16725]